MQDTEETAWLKSTANELNNLLQVISESSHMLGSQLAISGAESGETREYFAMLRHSIERATILARNLAERAEAAPGGQLVPRTPKAGSREENKGTLPEAPPLPPLPATGPLVPPLSGDVRVFNPSGTRELVMIVDDEEFVSLIAQRLLTDDGYRVITARDGFQAIEMYRKLRDQIALILLDFTMPVMDGADVFAELQEINPKVPVVLSSGFAEQGRLQSMLSRGLRGFIPKPYTHNKLLSQVRSILDAIKAEETGERRIF